MAWAGTGNTRELSYRHCGVFLGRFQYLVGSLGLQIWQDVQGIRRWGQTWVSYRSRHKSNATLSQRGRAEGGRVLGDGPGSEQRKHNSEAFRRVKMKRAPLGGISTYIVEKGRLGGANGDIFCTFPAFGIHTEHAMTLRPGNCI